MARVFVSYSSTDRDFVLRLAGDLRQAGYDIWLDQWKITGREPYWDEIQAGIESCSHFIFVISPASIDRGSGARKELYHAAGLKPALMIIPVMVRETLFKDLPMLISPGEYQIHDFVHQPYEKMRDAVLQALAPDAAPAQAPKSSPAPRQRRTLIAAVTLIGLVILIGALAEIVPGLRKVPGATSTPPSATTAAPVTMNPTYTRTVRQALIIKDTEMYTGPGTNNEVVITVYSGTTTFIKGRTPNNAWLWVSDGDEFAGKYTGWIANSPDYVQVIGDLSSAPIKTN